MSGAPVLIRDDSLEKSRASFMAERKWRIDTNRAYLAHRYSTSVYDASSQAGREWRVVTRPASVPHRYCTIVSTALFLIGRQCRIATSKAYRFDQNLSGISFLGTLIFPSNA